MNNPGLSWKVLGLYIGGVSLVLLITARVLGNELEARGERDAMAHLQASAALLTPLAEHGFTAGADRNTFQNDLARAGNAAGMRITLIATDGLVLADSAEDPAQMENHADRPEVREALRLGAGSSTRYSHTLHRRLLYHATRIGPRDAPAGTLRVSVPIRPLEAIWERWVLWLTGSAVTISILAAAFGVFLNRSITAKLRRLTRRAEQIAAGDYSSRLFPQDEGELGVLADAINRLAGTVRERVAQLTANHSNLEAILGGMTEGVIALDEADQVLHINDAAGRILAMNHRTAIGKPLGDAVRAHALMQANREAQASGTTHNREITLWVEGREHTIALHAAPIRSIDSAARRIGTVVVMHDVTDLRQLASRQREFVANVSHELKTPLTAMRALLETVLDDPAMAGEQRSRFLTKAQNQLARLETLVTDLLSLSRLQNLDTHHDPEMLDFVELVSHTVQALTTAAEAKRHTLVVDLPPAPLRVLGDPESLRQAVSNLVDNAIKYTPEEGRIEVSAAARGSRVELAVVDSGIGIHPNDQERIFERFYRVEKGRSRAMGGTGLGLSIVKHTVRIHNGTIAVESQPGHGATFRLTFPAAAERAGDETQPAER